MPRLATNMPIAIATPATSLLLGGRLSLMPGLFASKQLRYEWGDGVSLAGEAKNINVLKFNSKSQSNLWHELKNIENV